MKRLTRLKDGNHIGIAALEIDMIPAAAILDSDNSTALKKNMTVFAEMINTVAHGSIQQDTVLELLCVTTPITGQAYKAQPKLFIVARKFGRNAATIESKLRTFCDSCSASLQSTSYKLKSVDESWEDLQHYIAGVREESALSLEKQVRIGQFSSQTGYVCYINPYKLEHTNNFERVYEAMTHYPGMVLTFQIIPTTFIPTEVSFIQEVMLYIDMPMRPGQPTIQANNAVDYYRRIWEVLDKHQFLYNIMLFGTADATTMVGSRLRSILQHEDEAVGLTLTDRTGQLPRYAASYAMYPWNMVTYKTQHPAKPEIVPRHFMRMIHMISTAEVMTFFHAPIDDGNIIGFPVNRIRMSRETFANGIINEKSIQLGKLMGTGSTEVPFGAPMKNFTRHALIVGMTGTGKTTFSISLLLQFYKRGIPFLAIEPTKSEYRAMIDAVPDLQIFTPGKNNVVPFIINPFLPPEGINLEVFKSSLVSAFKAAFSMPNPLDILFASAIDACYIKHGWRGYSKRGDLGTRLFGLHEFILTFREIIRNSEYAAESKGNMESAGVFRLLNLIVQNGNIYDTEKSVPLYDLLRKPTIIELDAIDNQEQKALIMALLLINIILYTKHNQIGDGKLKNILLIDEAHVLLGGETQTQEGSAEAGASTVRNLQNMIVGIRSYGTGIIIADQSPQKVTKEIVGNTDVKIMFQLIQTEDKNIIAASSNMDENDKDQLSRLNTGEAYAYFRELGEPVRIMTEDIRKKEGIRLVVPDSELQKRMHYWDDKQELLKPYSDCSVTSVCGRCDFTLRDDAKYYMDQLFMKDKAQIKDKNTLFSKVINMEKRLKELNTNYEGERFRQLLYCVCVRYIRKAALETSAILSCAETERVLIRVLNLKDEKKTVAE